MSDVQQARAGRPAVHHLDRQVAVANTGSKVMLTVNGTAIQLSPEQAGAIGWGLVEAAASIEPITGDR